METRGMSELRDTLHAFVADPERLSLLALQLYEVHDGCRQYAERYNRIFSLPADEASKREELAQILTEIMVLIEDVQWHASELHEEIRSALDEIDKDGNQP